MEKDGSSKEQNSNDSNIELKEIYEIAVNEEQHYENFAHKTITLYWGVISASIMGIISIATIIDNRVGGLILITGGIVVFVVSGVAWQACDDLYRRYLEAVVFRAMTELRLGLTQITTNNNEFNYWPSESIVPTKQVNYRQQFDSSKDYISHERRNSKSYQSIAKKMFLVFMLVSIGFVTIGIYVFKGEIKFNGSEETAIVKASVSLTENRDGTQPATIDPNTP